MKVKKLYTAGDGFCCNHIWPMWSQLLAEILDCEWVNLSTYGAGNEAIANLVIDQIGHEQDCTDSLWLIQWTGPRRLDLRIDHVDADNQLITDISNDPVYYDNFISSADQKKYWCSSASSLTFVKNYRELLSYEQHIDRSRNHLLSLAYVLNQKKVNWKYLLTYDAPWLPLEFIDKNQCILQSMESFRKISQYKNLDIGEIQPVSSIHLDFLEKFVLPLCYYDNLKFETIKNKILISDRIQYDKHVTHM